MDSAVATQLITVGSTLGAVVLTLLSNGYLERRRARDVRDMEALRLSSEHARWLRDERLKAYAGLSIVGEEMLHFFRSELSMLVESVTDVRRDEVEDRWRQLRKELRKTYNQVALFGTDPARDAALIMWRTARNGGNDLLRDLGNDREKPADNAYLAERLKDVASKFGTAGDRFLEVCRKDLQEG